MRLSGASSNQCESEGFNIVGVLADFAILKRNTRSQKRCICGSKPAAKVPISILCVQWRNSQIIVSIWDLRAPHKIRSKKSRLFVVFWILSRSLQRVQSQLLQQKKNISVLKVMTHLRLSIHSDLETSRNWSISNVYTKTQRQKRAQNTQKMSNSFYAIAQTKQTTHLT